MSKRHKYNKQADRNYNWESTLRRWVSKATEDVPLLDRIVMIRQADELIAQGGLRGDITEHWLARFQHRKPILKDLFL